MSLWEQWGGQASFKLLSSLQCSIKNEALDLGWEGGKGCLVYVIMRRRNRSNQAFCVYYVPDPGLSTLFINALEPRFHSLTLTKI